MATAALRAHGPQTARPSPTTKSFLCSSGLREAVGWNSGHKPEDP